MPSSIALFTREKRAVSNSNIWAMEVHPRLFAYELKRPPIPGGRFLRVEFDLSRPMPAAAAAVGPLTPSRLATARRLHS